MRILFLTRSFNSLAQRLYLELTSLGHEVSIEFDIADAVTIEAVALFRPDLVVAPFLQRAIPEAVWRDTVCLVVHPGIVGDRGPSALDWAIVEGEREWGVTVLQAVAELDAGPVWASETFAMRTASKSSLYRNEVTEAAALAVTRAVQRFAATGASWPAIDTEGARGRWRASMKQADRRIDWAHDDTQTILRRIRAADGTPGVLDQLFGRPCHLYDAHADACDSHMQPHHAHADGRDAHVQPRDARTTAPARPAAPGAVIARRDHAVLRATVDGAVWIGHVRRVEAEAFKLPTAFAFAAEVSALPERSLAIDAPEGACSWREIRYEAADGVGTVHFDFYNGAMSTAQCERLNAALRFALRQPERVLVLLGGTDFWSNGIHLNVIEAAESPADESWRNITAVDDLTQTLIEATDRIVVAAMRGNAGAGGVFMALAADHVWARGGVILNPHYKNMGNLYGSEYWTYLLPRRLRTGTPGDVMAHRLPLSAGQAARLGLVDEVFDPSAPAFLTAVHRRAAALAARHDLASLLLAKQERRRDDEARKPLAAYRAEELERIRRNFYGFDPSYHIARSNFVRRVAPSWTPRHLSIHR